jgi:hypothetical protein
VSPALEMSASCTAARSAAEELADIGIFPEN